MIILVIKNAFLTSQCLNLIAYQIELYAKFNCKQSNLNDSNSISSSDAHYSFVFEFCPFYLQLDDFCTQGPLCSCYSEATSELDFLIFEVLALEFPFVYICQWFILSLFFFLYAKVIILPVFVEGAELGVPEHISVKPPVGSTVTTVVRWASLGCKGIFSLWMLTRLSV